MKSSVSLTKKSLNWLLLNPSELNVEELLYAATLTSDPAKQEAIYTQATKQFPNDYRGYNNLGKLAYQAGNIDKALNLTSRKLPALMLLLKLT